MKYFELDKEEGAILKDYEEGKMRRVRNAAKKNAEHSHIARYTLNKTKNINIRISESDLHNIKVKASEKGIPYQTLVSSLIHQYSRGKVSEEI